MSCCWDVVKLLGDSIACFDTPESVIVRSNIGEEGDGEEEEADGGK